MMVWVAVATVATLWTIAALFWLAVLVPRSTRQPSWTDDPRGEAPGSDSTQTND
jgi:hypothetical protein